MPSLALIRPMNCDGLALQLTLLLLGLIIIGGALAQTFRQVNRLATALKWQLSVRIVVITRRTVVGAVIVLVSLRKSRTVLGVISPMTAESTRDVARALS